MALSSVQSIVGTFGSIKNAHCEKHGEYQSFVIKGHAGTCPECFNEAERVSAEHGALRTLEENAARKKAARLSAAGIPQRFAECSLDNFIPNSAQQQKILNASRAYAQNFADSMPKGQFAGRCVIFCGAPGTGKTHLSAAILHNVLEQGYTGRYLPMLSATRMLKDCMKNGRSETSVLDELAEPDLLVLDEVGIQFESDIEIQRVYEIVNARYDAKRPTIFTSNDTLEEMVLSLGDRVIDRLRDNKGLAFTFTWDSYRKT